MRGRGWFVVAALVVLTGCARIEGAGGTFRTGGDLVVPSSETVDGDLYISGGNVTVDGPVRGDVYAAGGTVGLNGRVSGDLVVAGGQVSVRGPVDGNIVAAGGQVDLSGPVGGDALAAAGQITVGGAVSGDVRAFGGAISMTGRVGEDALATSGTVDLAAGADVGGDLFLQAEGATIGGTVRGDLLGNVQNYSRTGSVGGRDGIIIVTPEDPQPAATRDIVGDRVRTLLTLLIVGLILMWLVPGWVRAASGRVIARPLASLGWGLVAWVGLLFGLIVFTVAWILLAVLFGVLTLGGIVAAVVASGVLADLALVLGLFLMAGFIAWVVVGLAVGDFSLSRTSGRSANRFLAVALGVVILVVAASVPVLDVITTVLVLLAGMGALALAVASRGGQEVPASAGPANAGSTTTGPPITRSASGAPTANAP